MPRQRLGGVSPKISVAFYEEHGIGIERVLSDNGYRSFAWRDACAELGIQRR